MGQEILGKRSFKKLVQPRTKCTNFEDGARQPRTFEDGPRQPRTLFDDTPRQPRTLLRMDPDSFGHFFVYQIPPILFDKIKMTGVFCATCMFMA